MKKPENSSYPAAALHLILGLTLTGAFVAFVSNTLSSSNPPAAQSTSTRDAGVNAATLQVMPAQEVSSMPVVSITPLENNGQIDMAALDMHPMPVSSGVDASFKNTTPDGAAIGNGNAFLGITHEIVNQNTANAFGTLSSGWTAGESIQFYLNGSLAGTFVASAGGTLAVGISTGSGFGYITVDEIGLTSGKETGGVLHVASTGPYLPGVTAAPHAINTSAGGSFLLGGSGYPASSTVNLYRNGAFIGTASTDSSGKYLVGIIPGNNGNTSAVYSSDNGTVGSMAGTTVEERTDAGTPPAGDQNSARAFLDHAMLNSAIGGMFALVGEGFQPGETVTLSGCASGSFPANVNGGAAFFLFASPVAGVYNCVLTGGATGRIARASVLAHPNVTNLRGLILAPAFVNPGGNVLVMADKLPFAPGNIYLDGVLQGSAWTGYQGTGTFILNKPASGFVHAVSWITNGNGSFDAQSAVLLLGPPGPTPTPTPTSTPTSTPFSCVPVTQGFDDITTLPGSGWVQINHSQPGPGITNWFQGSTAEFSSQSGAPNSYIAANYDNGTGTSTLSNWLLTQPVTLQNGFMLTFWTRTVTAPALPDRLQVRMSTNGTSTNVGATATDVGDFSTLLLDINPTYTTSGYPNVWTQFTVSVTGVPTMTTGRLAFRYFVENGGPTGANSDYIGIDTVQYDCDLPTPTATPVPPTPTPTSTPQPIPTPIVIPPGCPTWSVTIALPVATIAPSPSGVVLIPVTTSYINTGDVSLSGFQGDFTFDSSVITFASPPVARGGLTSDPIWNVSANIIGTTQIRTLRISTFQNQFRPLVGGPDTLFYLRVQAQTSTLGSSTPLTWAPRCGGNEFIFIDDAFNSYDVNQTNGVITIQSGPSPTPSPTPTPTPTPTSTPTPTPIKISGTISYCSNSVPGPVPGVTLTVTGSALASTISDDSGNYQVSILSNGGTYTVTPTKAARPPGSANINTVDVIAVQRHYLQIGPPLSGCQLTAADVNGDGRVDTRDVTAINRFSLGQTTGINNVGKYRFIPANRTYTNITTDQIGQNYDAFIFGDVASHFVEPIATAIPTPTPH